MNDDFDLNLRCKEDLSDKEKAKLNDLIELIPLVKRVLKANHYYEGMANVYRNELKKRVHPEEEVPGYWKLKGSAINYDIQDVFENGFEKMVDLYEKSIIEMTLSMTKGNQTEAAHMLKTTKRVVQYKCQKLSIDCNIFKSD